MIRHPLFDALGLEHGFGERGDAEPPQVCRPKQVHGSAIALAPDCAGHRWPEADGVVATETADPVAVVTADCVPILLAAEDGRAVAAVHAGWRGLAAGVVEAGVTALRRAADEVPLRAVVGPCVGACCYEVDGPVLEALGARYPQGLEGAIRARRDRHADLDLGGLALQVLADLGVDPRVTGRVGDACTVCDARRFHSYRRDGPHAGRLLHFIRAKR